jgi:hypothetical protein
MKTPHQIVKYILAPMVLLLLLSPTGNWNMPAAQSATAPSPAGQFVSIDFNNVDINVFIKFISELTGKNFVVDQRVRGKVTIISPSKISLEEAYTKAIDICKENGPDPEYKYLLDVMVKIADAFDGIVPQERKIIDSFVYDLKSRFMHDLEENKLASFDNE